MEPGIAETTDSASTNLRSQKILLSTLMDLPVLRCTTGVCHGQAGRCSFWQHLKILNPSTMKNAKLWLWTLKLTIYWPDLNFFRRSVLDMFNFLASKHRQPPVYNPREEDEEEMLQKSARWVTLLILFWPPLLLWIKTSQHLFFFTDGPPAWTCHYL